MVGTIFIIPVMIIVVGYLMYKYPPQKVNWFVGYRTIRSMKNENVWEKANKYCGKLWIKIGLIMVVLASVLAILSYIKIVIFSETCLAIIILCEILPLLLSGLMVEKEIKDEK